MILDFRESNFFYHVYEHALIRPVEQQKNHYGNFSSPKL
jgi:hypothetical protein